MERRGAEKSNLAVCLATVVVVVLLLLMVAQPSEAEFMDCYRNCFLLCVFAPEESLSKCSFRCLIDCILPPPNFTTNRLGGQDGDLTEYFCKLGCSLSLCTKISTKTNPDEVKVSGCVDSCSGRCSNSKK
ncbi:hypothetical protein SAY86_025841 [Trapa natans]|uniref:Thionin-like protein 2 n=1 Tax=Trapa natans TaxID=22666 RepID=A0AAN7KIR2_TRANT|nr:hypothetical protein SAY86_025841 [Trapa natans]